MQLTKYRKTSGYTGLSLVRITSFENRRLQARLVSIEFFKKVLPSIVPFLFWLACHVYLPESTIQWYLWKFEFSQYCLFEHGRLGQWLLYRIHRDVVTERSGIIQYRNALYAESALNAITPGLCRGLWTALTESFSGEGCCSAGTSHSLAPCAWREVCEITTLVQGAVEWTSSRVYTCCCCCSCYHYCDRSV